MRAIWLLLVVGCSGAPTATASDPSPIGDGGDAASTTAGALSNAGSPSDDGGSSSLAMGGAGAATVSSAGKGAGGSAGLSGMGGAGGSVDAGCGAVVKTETQCNGCTINQHACGNWVAPAGPVFKTHEAAATWAAECCALLEGSGGAGGAAPSCQTVPSKLKCEGCQIAIEVCPDTQPVWTTEDGQRFACFKSDLGDGCTDAYAKAKAWETACCN
jgi:hypothetical protein